MYAHYLQAKALGNMEAAAFWLSLYTAVRKAEGVRFRAAVTVNTTRTVR